MSARGRSRSRRRRLKVIYFDLFVLRRPVSHARLTAQDFAVHCAPFADAITRTARSDGKTVAHEKEHQDLVGVFDREFAHDLLRSLAKNAHA